MRHRVLGFCASALLALSAAAPVFAAPPDKLEEPFLFLFPDPRLGLVAFINTDRATYCTPDVVAWEEAFADWIDGGGVGDPPEFPGSPVGFDPIAIQDKETGRGALVHHVMGSGLTIELWELDAPADAPGVGPCTDSDDALNRIARGTASFMNNDNDLFGSGTRGNAFGTRILAFLQGDDGTSYKYSFRFHLNSQCPAPEGEAPHCLIDSSTLQVH